MAPSILEKSPISTVGAWQWCRPVSSSTPPKRATAFGRDDLRERVEGLLRADIPPARAHGDDRKSDQVSDTKLISEQPDASYVVARLKRDNPEIANAVINGTITPNAAAIQTG